MKAIIRWLREIEHLVGEMYYLAASTYSDDTILKNFFEYNAEDEAWHYHVMGSAVEYLSSQPDFVPAISIDEETSGSILKQISDITNGLQQQTIQRDELIEKIVELELSEWNDIFIYTVNFLKDKTSEFKYPAVRIQAHLKGIEYFLSSVEQKPETLQKIRGLPPVWIENILIVDDQKMLTDLIKSLLKRSGNIDIVYNGREALKMLEEKYYKLIVSDIDMPIMDGITFYKKAVEKYPASKNRFLFMTGDLSPERQSFFKDNNLKCLEKPMDIKVLREEAEKIIISK